MLDQLLITVNVWMTGSLLLAAAGCLACGMVSVLLSPCHLASIPLIVGYVAGQGKLIQGWQAARYALAFTLGLFATIAAVGVACSLLGRMLGDIGPYWTILVGALLFWVGLDMLGLTPWRMSGGGLGGLLGRFKVRGVSGAFLLGLAYGVLSGSCTFGFIAPILALITIQDTFARGMVFIVLFAVGHCLPIVAAGSSTALVTRWMAAGPMRHGAGWFRRLAGAMIAVLGVYFILRPFAGA